MPQIPFDSSSSIVHRPANGGTNEAQGEARGEGREEAAGGRRGARTRLRVDFSPFVCCCMWSVHACVRRWLDAATNNASSRISTEERSSAESQKATREQRDSDSFANTVGVGERAACANHSSTGRKLTLDGFQCCSRFRSSLSIDTGTPAAQDPQHTTNKNRRRDLARPPISLSVSLPLNWGDHLRGESS